MMPDSLSPSFVRLSEFFNRHDWAQSTALATRLLAQIPEHPLVHYIAGVSAMEQQQMPQALTHLHQATHLAPERLEFMVAFAKALATSRLTTEALEAADRARALTPNDPLALDTLGVVYSQINAFAQAAEVFQQATALAPQQPSYRYNLATALVATGDLDAAERELATCLALDPSYWRAHLTLAQLRRQTPEKNHIEELESRLMQVEHKPADLPAHVCLNMALAKEYEDLGDYSNAFDHYIRGKSAAGHDRAYDFVHDEALFKAIQESFPVPITKSISGYQTDEPIFVIGMPRTGTTLVERIISSHPDVHSAGELLNFPMSLRRASGSRHPALINADIVARAHNADWVALGHAYLDSTRPATGSTAHFIDKLPHNFLYAGFIASALPNARIICLRRDPMDTCLSNFRQLFARKSPFFDYSFDLLDTGRYYVLFDRLMAHWQKVLPGRIFEVDYETLVEAQEESSRRLLAFCGLSWHDACLRFESNPAPVATASAVQVRAPIYRRAVRRWKKYEAQLVGLKHLLLDSGVKVND